MQASYTVAPSYAHSIPTKKSLLGVGELSSVPLQTFPQKAKSHTPLKMPGKAAQNFRIIYIFLAQFTSKQSSNFGPNFYIFAPTTLPFFYLFP